ncbi:MULTISPECIES: ribonuclease P protein component [unclassified Lactococcus]|uniref:ribonuclease P protein component n=1 Tax=unclassified Lactococcus TaxID=2643510 RepID=UPI00164FD8BC|nr:MULTISPECIES: ribonuclease P protein component [unclassified Lactococcus]
MEESGLAIKKEYRVKRSKDFDQIFTAKHSFANRKFVVYTLNTEQKHYRVGISVSKKLGHAVVRNRVKRLIRHAVAEFSPNIEKVDFVIIARSGVQDLTFEEVKKNLKHVLKLSNIYVDGEID